MDARILDYMQRYKFKKVVICNDTDTGLRAVIAIHSTALGPATGGLRMWTYAKEEDAIFDAMRSLFEDRKILERNFQNQWSRGAFYRANLGTFWERAVRRVRRVAGIK